MCNSCSFFLKTFNSTVECTLFKRPTQMHKINICSQITVKAFTFSGVLDLLNSMWFIFKENIRSCYSPLLDFFCHSTVSTTNTKCTAKERRLAVSRTGCSAPSAVKTRFSLHRKWELLQRRDYTPITLRKMNWSTQGWLPFGKTWVSWLMFQEKTQTPKHLCFLLPKKWTGIEFMHHPYRCDAPAEAVGF